MAAGDAASGIMDGRCQPSMCAGLLGSMRAPYLLAHLFLGSASPDLNMPRVAAVNGVATEPDVDLVLPTINLIIQAMEAKDVLGLPAAPVISKLALMGAAAGDAGDGVGLLVRLCGNVGMLRLAVQTLLNDMHVYTSTHYDAKEQALQNQRADAIQLLLSSHGAAGEDPRERVHIVLLMLTDEGWLQSASSEMPSSPLSPSRMGGAEGGGNVILLKRLVRMLVVASRLPRALVWLQENRARWVWMQKQLAEQHRRADQRSQSFVGLVSDLNEIAGYCDKTGVRVVGAGEGVHVCMSMCVCA
jgi:hypothetical protein